MVQLITNAVFRGNKKLRESLQGPAIYSVDLDFATPEEYVFDFTLLQQSEQLGLVKTLYFDNSVNPKIAEINVSQTGQYLVCPPFSVGFFPLTCMENSTVSIQSVGGVTGDEKCYAAFYNYDVPPFVWNGFAPLVDGARVTLIGVDGVTNMSATNPLIMGGNDAGTPRPVKVDAQGRLEVIGSAVGGSVYGPNAAGLAPTQPPLLVSGIDPGGLIRTLLTTVTGLLRVNIDATSLSGATSMNIQGAGAIGVNPVGNPVGTGGVATAAGAMPTTTAGFRVNFGTDLYGNLRSAILGMGSASADNVAPTVLRFGSRDNYVNAYSLGVIPEVYNGATNNRIRDMIGFVNTGAGVAASGMVGQYLLAPPTLVSGDYGRVQLTASGDLKTYDTVVATNTTRASVGTPTNVAMTGSSVTVLTALSTRKRYTLWNDGAVPINVILAASAASATSFTFILAASGFWDDNDYTGEVRAIGASGTLRVTSLS